MSDIGAPQEPFGVGAVISESFSIFFKRLIPILIVGFVVFFLASLVSALLLGMDVATGQTDPFGIDPTGDLTGPTGGEIAGFFVSALFGLIAYSLMVSVFVLLAYDAKLGRPARLGGYFGAALPVIVPTIVLSVVMWILIVFGFLLLIVPGLWLAALFSVVIPAIVIERAGYSALGRSAQLTKGYRWSIVGVYAVMFLIVIVVSLILGAVIAGLAALLLAGGGTVGFGSGLTFLAINAVTSALSYGFTAIMSAIIYARLRELKEGVSVASLVDVFR
ncbi:MAG: hypothetical protein AAFR47_01635 [Pseudomonadota bacterium]